MIRTILIGASCATIGGAAVAGANVSHIVGHGGPTVQLTEKCTRQVVAAPGESLEMSVNVIGQQVHCLIRRPDPFARCVSSLKHGLPEQVVGKFDHGANKPGDWTHVDQLYDYTLQIGLCADEHLSGR